MPIICLFGPDASGKSTLARALVEELRRRGFKARSSWMRGTHTLASLIARLLSRFDALKGTDNPYYQIAIPKSLRRLWQLLEFSSALPVVLFRFVIPSALGYWVVADRYVTDLVAWVSVTTRDHDYVRRGEGRFLLALASRARVKVYVTAALEELIKRREASSRFLNEQIEVYERIAPIVRAKKLDTTNKGADDSVREVLSLLNVMGASS